MMEVATARPYLRLSVDCRSDTESISPPGHRAVHRWIGALPGKDILGMVIAQIHLCRLPDGDALFFHVENLEIIRVWSKASASPVVIAD
jgi:hypothetical protein